MAIDADPQSTFPIVLEEHMDLPEDQRPRLWFRRCTRRDSKQLLAAMEELDAFAKDRQRAGRESRRVFQLYETIERLLKDRLVHWENQVDEEGRPLPFEDPEDLERIIDEYHLMELASRIPNASSNHFHQKKASASPSGSGTDSSAPTADPRPATTDATGAKPPRSSAPDAADPGETTPNPAPTAAGEANSSSPAARASA